MDIPALKRKFDDAVSPFKGKDKKTVLKNGSFNRETLIETVFSLIDVCEGVFTAESKSNSLLNAKDIALACAETTEAVLKKFLPQQGTFTNSAPAVSTKSRPSDASHVLVVEEKGSDDGKFTTTTWSDVVRNSISEKLKDVQVSSTTVNRQGQGCIFLPSEKACADAKKALDSDFKLTATPKNGNKLWPKLKIHNVPADCTKELLQSMIVSKNPGVSHALSSNEHAKLSVIFVEKKHNFAVLKVTPDVREEIMKSASIFVGMSSLFVTDHFYIERCFACQRFGHKQESEDCPAKGSNEVCMFCAGSHKTSDCRKKTSKLCANCARSSSHAYKINAKFHISSSNLCPVYQKEVEKLKMKTCYDIKNYI